MMEKGYADNKMKRYLIKKSLLKSGNMQEMNDDNDKHGHSINTHLYEMS